MDGENAFKPSISTNPFGVKQVYWERLQNMRLLDDAFMRATLKDNIPAIQLILRTVMGKEDLVVLKAEVQADYKSLYGRSLVLDVVAIDGKGNLYNIEIQQDEKKAYPERGRYHMAVIDSNALEKNQPFSDLPTTYVIFVTAEDYYEMGQPVYHVDRTVEETGKKYGDRGHIIYVNGAYQGNNDMGRLMADFRERDPSKMHHQELAGRAYDLKNKEDEVRKMCMAMEATYNEGLTDGIKKGREEGREEGDQTRGVQDVENLMDTLGLSLTEAFKALRVPMEKHQIYSNLITQRRLVAGKG